MSDRLLPPLPRPSSPSVDALLASRPSTETDFWAGLFLDLTIRVEWLGQALDAVPMEDASASAVVRVRSYARSLGELKTALSHVQAHRGDPALRPLFALDGPLAGYLSRLYAWCEEIGEDFERMAVALRQKKPTSVVFAHGAVNRSFAQFAELVAAMRGVQVEHAGKALAQWRALDEHIEELVWATEWVHMTLARPPGST